MAMFISDPSSALATTGSLAGISEPRANKGSDMKKGHGNWRITKDADYGK
jgi:hypothetical protein